MELFPGFKPWVENLKRRMLDLLTPFKSCHYYHPQQLGSASIKAVMPAITGQGYDGLEIAEGATASLGFIHVHFCCASGKRRRSLS